MKIADVIVDMIENESLYLFINKDSPIVIPKLDHKFCQEVLNLAGKSPSKGFGKHKIDLECNRVARALENDGRFEKFIHITGCKAYKYKGDVTMPDKITINLGDNIKLIAKKNTWPYDEEINIYLEDNEGFLQDLVAISPDYDIARDELNYNNKNFSIKVFENKNDEDFTTEINIPRK